MELDIFHTQMGLQPQTFEEIRGQPYIEVLKAKLERGIVSPLYLLIGPNGTGKTVTAKVLTRALLCEDLQGINPCNRCSSCRQLLSLPQHHHPYVHWCSGPQLQKTSEFDAIRHELYNPPTSRFRIVVIDEASSLDSRVKNSILVLTEDPVLTSYNVFILCTMQPEALGREMLAAMAGRGTPLIFNPVPTEDIFSILVSLVKDMDTTDLDTEVAESLRMIAIAANGSVRQALQMLESTYMLDNQLSSKATTIVTRLIPKLNRRAIWRLLRENDFRALKEFIRQECGHAIVTPENYYRSLLEDLEEALLRTKDPRLLEGINLLNRAMLSSHLDPVMVTYQLQPYGELLDQKLP